MMLKSTASSSSNRQESNGGEEHDRARDSGNQEFGAGQVMGANRFTHGQRDEDVEKRSGRQHYQDGFCESVYSAEHGAAAHFPLRHIFALPFRLTLRGVIDFDAGDYDQDDDYDDEFDHDFFSVPAGLFQPEPPFLL